MRSRGVAEQSGFEADLAARGIHVFKADFSVDEPAQSNARFFFTKKYVGCLSDGRYIDAGRVEEQHHRLLQMDIEGAEFETLMSGSGAFVNSESWSSGSTLCRISWTNRGSSSSADCLKTLLQTHSVAHPFLAAQSRRTQSADECPLLGAKPTLTNRCLPTSIYEYTT